MLLHRYHNIDFILALDLQTGLELCREAAKQERDARLFQQWCVQLPFMGTENFIPFAEYRDNLTGVNIDLRPTTEILKELEEVEKKFDEGGGSTNGT